MPNPHPFVGTWKLMSYKFTSEAGEDSHPFGENAAGILIYDAAGNISVQIMNPDCPLFASGDALNASPEEIKAAYESINSYFGTYDVDEAQGIVTHHVECASLPNRRGTDQIRHYELSGNQLILNAPPRLLKGQMLTGRLIWEKVT